MYKGIAHQNPMEKKLGGSADFMLQATFLQLNAHAVCPHNVNGNPNCIFTAFSIASMSTVTWGQTP
jgi:hypothetical protein